MKNNLSSLFFLLSLLILSGCHEPDTIKSPPTYQSPSFVGASTCVGCHPNEGKLWEESHHFHSMENSTRKSILAPFEGESVELDGVSYYMFQNSKNEYLISVEEKNHPKDTFKVVHTFGFQPLQQYLVASRESGGLQTLRISFDTKNNKWFHQYAGENIPPHDWLHWRQQSMNWNSMCADCHSTDVKKNYDPFSKTYQTTFHQENVSCESCHGPGENHVKQAQTKSWGSTKGFITNLEPDNYQNTCGACHSRRSKLFDGHDFKKGFQDQYMVSLLNQNHFQADGQIEDEDFVLTSFLSSRMAHVGVTCNNCHDPHSQKLKLNGNQLCLQCHESSFDSPKHHHHPVNTPGADCISCHMPGKTYMGNDFRRDHSFRIPRPDQSIKYGVTNACNQCHIDQTPDWANKKIIQWAGKERKAHFSDLLLSARKESKISDYFKIIQDTSIPDIVKATAIEDLGSYPLDSWVNQLENMVSNHKSAMVRGAFQGALFNQVQERVIPFIKRGLNDPVVSVKILAYRNALRLPKNQQPQTEMQKVKNLYLSYLNFNADFKEGRNHLAEYSVQENDIQAAFLHYQTSLQIDSLQRDPYINQAILHSQQKENNKALVVLKQYLEKFPEDDYGYYLIGILYLEEGNYTDAIASLEKAIEINPDNDRYWNNLSSAYQITNNTEALNKLTKRYEKYLNP